MITMHHRVVEKPTQIPQISQITQMERAFARLGAQTAGEVLRARSACEISVICVGFSTIG